MALAEGEIYPHLVVFECENDGLRYPASPRFGNMPMDDFGALQAMLRAHDRYPFVDIEADVIHSFVNRLRRVCVKMDGGNYFGGRIASNTLEIRQHPPSPAAQPQ